MEGLPTTLEVNAAVLLAMRVSGLVLVAPVLSSRAVSRQTKVVVICLFTVLLWPAATRAAAPGTAITAATFVTEWMVGIALGLGAMILVAAAESAGDMLAIQIGLAGGNVINPMSDNPVPVLGQLLGLFAVTMLLTTGGHTLMLDAFAATLDVVPPGSPLSLQEGAFAVVDLGSRLFLLGLRVAAPVIGAVMVGNVVLGVLARTVPQLNILMVAFPVQIGIGLLTIGVSMPLVASLYGEWPMLYEQVLESIVRGFTGQGPVDGAVPAFPIPVGGV
jgi:flagellar biosynthetic protein FliR